jgi:undecaprenyl diphosphate synthase
MVPSTLATPLHLAIIMDGNGRWATERGLPRSAGHAAGAEAVRRIVEAAPGAGIGTLSLYAFSADNWRRPETEVGGLFDLFQSYLAAEPPRLSEGGVRLTVMGRRDRLPFGLQSAIRLAERTTASGRRLHLRIAIDYSARDTLVAAAGQVRNRPLSRERLARLIGEADRGGRAPEVDLLIRTGGERRLSDFLLWESAYAELWFSDIRWPDFGAADLAEALKDFRSRDRRFGGLSPEAGAPQSLRRAGGAR